MTRPTKFGPARPQNIISIGGDPDLPAGQPTSDCCADPEDMPDRALDTGSVFIGIQTGDGSLVQSKIGTDAGGGSSLAFDSDTVAGNLLVCVLVDRGGTTGPFSLSGWTFIDEAGKSGASEVTMFWRVSPGGPVTVSFNPPTNEVRIYLMEFAGGAAGLSATPTTHDGGASVSSFPVPSLTVSVPSLLVGTVEAGNGVPNTITYTEDADFTNVGQGQVGGALSPESIVGYRVVAAGSYDYNPTGNNSSLGWGGILAAFTLGTGWGGGGPNATDGDDATYTEISGSNVIRIDLGAPFEIARIRLLIGTETSGSKSYTLKGANQADFSDAVTVTTLAWTATGSFTGDEVTDTWTPTDAYQYWELTGDDETRYVYSFELYEAGAQDASSVAADLADHIDEILTHHTAETDDSLVLAPDGAGGVEWRAEAGGGSSIYYNVLDYGAVGDNSTDDSTAIQDAVDANDAAGGGGTVFFPNGVTGYKITQTIVNTLAVAYLGDGGAGHDSSGPMVRMATANTTAFRSASTAYNVSFKNLYIKGPGGASSGAGIYSNNRNVNTQTVRVEGFFYGIRIGGQSYYSLLIDTMAYNNASHGIWQETGSNNLTILAPRATTNGGCGIKIDGSQSTKIIGGAVEGSTSHGISVDRVGGQVTDGTYIAGVYFENNGSASIKVGDTAQVRGTTITGCFFTSTQSGYYIDVEAADYITIGGNTFLGTPGSGDIRLQSGVTHAVLFNNRPSGVGNTFTSTPVILENAVDLTAVDFLVGTATGLLSGEIVVGTTPGGELGGTWASPTVDATHAGSTHIALSSSTPLVESGSGSAGSGTAASKDDHVHPASSSSGGIGGLAIDSIHSTPLVFGDILQASDGSDFLYTSP